MWRSPQYTAARKLGGAEWFAAPPLRSAAAQSLLASNIPRKPFITGPPAARKPTDLRSGHGIVNLAVESNTRASLTKASQRSELARGPPAGASHYRPPSGSEPSPASKSVTGSEPPHQASREEGCQGEGSDHLHQHLCRELSPERARSARQGPSTSRHSRRLNDAAKSFYRGG